MAPAAPPNIISATTGHEEVTSHTSTAPRVNKSANFNISIENLTQHAYPVPSIEELTPPSSAVSSQEQPNVAGIEPHLQVKPRTPSDSQLEVPRPQRTASDPESATRLSLQHETITGSKRTASGQYKRSSIQSLSDLMSSPNAARHAHNSSVLPNGNPANVQEISQHLKTRLTYAMLKVQNGWQARSLDEVESLASMSPRSARTGHSRLEDRYPVTSPRSAMFAHATRKYSDSDSSEDTATTRPQTANMPAPPVLNFNDHRTGSQGTSSLAPPADIIPGARRRPAPNHQIHIPSLNGLSRGPSQRRQVRPSVNQRTPSQNAAMEADAVETLLFMASPNNSSYNPPYSSQDSSIRSAHITQMSPLRAQFGQTTLVSPKRVAFSDQAMPSIKATVVDKNALIDRMLDGLPDESDEELENAFRLAEQSRGGRTSKLLT